MLERADHELLLLDNGPHEEKPEPEARNARAAPAAGGEDITAIKRELRAVLEQLQG